MPNKKLWDLPRADAITGNEVVPLTTAGANTAADLNFISAWFNAKPTAYNFGALSVEPTVSPFDGGPIPLGAQYYNTTTNQLRAYGSSGWFTPNIDAELLAEPGGATLVGTPTGTVQASLDARPTSAALAASGGTDLIGTKLSAVSAATRLVTQKIFDFVSVKDFGAIGDGLTHPLSDYFASLALAQVAYPNALALTDELDGVAIQAALNTGKNILVPDGAYLHNTTLKTMTTGQAFFSEGMNTATLRWTGNDTAINALEIASGRRDTGNPATFRRGRRFSGFYLEMAPGTFCKTYLWVENGSTADCIEHLRGTIHGRPTDAVLKFESGGGVSYSKGMLVWDIELRGAVQQDTSGVPVPGGIPIPCGLWLEGCIESYFHLVRLFGMDATVRFGTSVDIDERNVQDITLINFMAEIGVGSGRSNGSDSAACVEFYSGANIQFLSPKLVCNAHQAAGGQSNIAFKAGTASPIRGIAFDDFSFFNHAGAAATAKSIRGESGARISDVTFNRPKVQGSVGGIIGLAADVDGLINWTNPTYAGAVPVQNAVFRTRSLPRASATVANDAFEAFSLTNFQLPFGEPFLASYTLTLGGLMLSPYRASGFANGTVAIINKTGGDVVLGDGRVRYRQYQASEVRARRNLLWDPTSVAAGASLKVDVPVHGVQMGDFTDAMFIVTSTGALQGLILGSYVSAAGVVTVFLANPTATARNFAQQPLTIWMLQPSFDSYGRKAFTIPSINAGAVSTTTVTATGAAVGDFVRVSFDQDLLQLYAWGEVTAADTVTVSFRNNTVATISGIAAGNLAVGVYKRFDAL